MLVSFLFSNAEIHAANAQSGAVAGNQNDRQTVSSNSDLSKDVKQIQTLLTLLKFNPGPIDGIPGRKTTTAIKAFQREIGVPVTGKIDDNLKSQLDGAYKLIVIRSQREQRKEEKKPPLSPEKPKAGSNLPVAKPESKIDSGKDLEVKQSSESKAAVQREPASKEPASKDRPIKTENHYLNYFKIGFPIIAIIFLAYFYRIWMRANFYKIWTRANEKIRGEKKALKTKIKTDIETEVSEKAEPQADKEASIEVQGLEKEVVNTTGGKPESPQSETVDYHDPSHPGYITPVIRRKVWIRNKGQCAACGSRNDLQYDYIVPTLDGGRNTIDNLQLLCKTCHQEKSIN
jgi:5-methylcytosine-specific restriction endonuclease McrA